MKLTVLGCSGSVPGPDSAASSYLVTAEDFHLVLDLGSGALGSLQRHIAVPQIGAIGLSHLHPDHCMDLCGLYVAAKYAPGSPIPRIPVFAPPGAAERMALAYDLPLDPGMEEELDFQPWQEVQQIGPFTVRTAPMVHPVPAYAIRVEHNGKTLVYTGDTGPNEALIELARGADLLLSEAALPDDNPNNPVDLHLSPSDAGEHAKKACVKKLVITHVPPWFDRATQAENARRTYPGPIEIATPHAVFDI
ncbi:MBL fold metallo-hydrolase [Kribbella sandramycini]|uniref:MBL fold metallo-hydrolase n=1 Tax=Kribbella sandramycini TaxID=60450 RepID=A0A7Y4KWH0_9ACTN|nr:MBL fold metallo-hydrolase [Kribbella sandramycini]MBB6567479.1 ribonuclease BN (tRNA processing enzyme) [Kribbella sandramycini]NOL39913.1 MBL fold metallo-hydrolase [Kribbella sandramycini]